ncbi:hypothetical protein NA57DRAFT_74436 [Rhizodiscina lignyota]|uniref:BTB domain-containing protein n=1 Tax=Rhizodiscina lignyota TaxID=1504668 RepID=A0A9P4IJK2_9PEZI|nr:hypothetical protein NA57DRAFT_74436 [Rhizodiscina lignyota]
MATTRTADVMTPETYEPPPISEIEPEFIDVRVGPSKKSHIVHKILLCLSSQNFATALNGGFAGRKSETLHLPHVLEDVFKTYMDWLYQGRLKARYIKTAEDAEDAVVDDADDEDSDDEEADAEYDKESCIEKFNALHDVYIFADRYLIPQLQRAAIDQIILICKRPSFGDIRSLYEAVSQSSPLCQFYIDAWAHEGCHVKEGGRYILPSEYKTLPQAFVLGVFLESVQRTHDQMETWNAEKKANKRKKGKEGKKVKRYNFPWDDLCNYHAHVSKEHREACTAKRKAAKGKN